MYRASYKDEKQTFDFKFPWHTNTAKGFAISIPTVLLLIFIMNFMGDLQPEARIYRPNSVPIELLSFGFGDGTGVSKGNLAREGEARKGQTPQSDLHDAEIAAKTAATRNPVSNDPTESSNLVPRSELSGAEKQDDNLQGSSSRNIGAADGSEIGTGLGTRGSGPGKGEGFGDIEWGGGGNRVVISKRIPTYPPGVNTSAQIRIRFTVRADGTVSSMVPLQKADPRLERAAMDALRQWRFNPLASDDDREMIGVIPFTFRLR